MSTRSNLLVAAALVAACQGPPPPPSPPTPPPAVPVRPQPQLEAAPPAQRAADSQLLRLDNGMPVIATSVRPGKSATLQFAITAGTSFVAPGIAELAAHVLADGADLSQGRQSLRAAIAKLGGTLQVQPGPLTVWLDVRVPGNRWQQALIALRAALESPAWSRSQIERIREQFVAERAAELRADPAGAMAKLLMLGESSSAAHVLSLLDRDPGEISLFLARACQPARSLLAIEVPADAATVVQELARNGKVALAAWNPPPAPAGALALLDRKFESGLYWSPAPKVEDRQANCRVALVTMFTDPGQPGNADELVLLGCFSLDGNGGRLARLQHEHGLDHVRWTGSVLQTTDAVAQLLVAEVPAKDVAALWRTAELARRSLQEVPPSQSEIAIALARAPLTARLSLLDDGARVRLQAGMVLRGAGLDTFEKQLAARAARPDQTFGLPAMTLLARPFAMVVIGGEPPPELTTVHRFELLPAGHLEPSAAAAPANDPTPAPKSQPWLDRACDAAGGIETLRRLTGWTSEAAITHAEAPPMTETVQYSPPDNLQRTRTLLGQTIVTRLTATEYTETLGKTVRSLDAKQAALLRREMQRHPLALLAAYARGEIAFRTVAQRDSGDRTMAVLEAATGPFDRLRIHIDVESLLVRTVAFAILMRAENVLAWLTTGGTQGIAAGILLAAIALALPRAARLALAAVLLTAATVLVNLAPPNPYTAAMLKVWAQGHFLNFNGLTRLVAMLWPFAAIAYAFALASRPQRGAVG